MPHTRWPSQRHRARPRPVVIASCSLCLLLAACGGIGNIGSLGEDVSVRLTAAALSPARIASLPRSNWLTLDAADWAELSLSSDAAHEDLPAGVPAGYDWRERGQVHAGLTVPTGFYAFIGWAQAFWIEGAQVGQQSLEIRQMQTLLCVMGSGGPQWHRLQQGEIEGASFRADYANNENVPAVVEQADNGYIRISFPSEWAYHFWSKQGRITMTNAPLCGLLVLWQARAVMTDGQATPDGTAPSILIGGGADYWLNTSVAWDQYRTNASVGVGRLRRVHPDWRWFGYSVATPSAIETLRRDGFIEGSNP